MRMDGWNVLDRREDMDLRLVIFSEGGLRFVWICIIRVSRYCTEFPPKLDTRF